MRLTIIWCLLFVLFSCGNGEGTSSSKKVENTSNKEVTQKQESSATKQSNLTYNLGEDYQLLATPYTTESPKHVIVYEFFGYTCPHCFHFEPFMDKWLSGKKDYAKLQRVPLNFNPSWSIFQQAYLTAEVMGLVDESHIKLFEALHEEHKRFNTIDQLAQWYAENTNVDKEAFLSTAESFILDSKLRQADKMGFQMQVTSTPTVVVNGKYKVSTKIRNRDEVINVIRFLVQKEAKEMGLN